MKIERAEDAWRNRVAKSVWPVWARLRHAAGRTVEACRFTFARADEKAEFFVVSCSRNAGAWAVRCLESVYDQDYDRARVKHVYVDDASTDDTQARVEAWLAAHPGHSVQYIRRQERRGGARNTLDAMRQAPPRTIVLELNGDDWLPDPGVLKFLKKVYADPNVWMTYNTLRYADGKTPLWPRAAPLRVIRTNTYRDHKWLFSHLHTFRQELFAHVRAGSLIDPLTGTYWKTADDLALYLSMLELAGKHARHIYRTTYVYNFRETSEYALDAGGNRDCARRICQMPRYQPLQALESDNRE